MLWFNDKISLRQLQILMIINIFGTGVAMLPRLVAERGGQDGWLLILMATLFALGCCYVITALCVRFPDKSFFEYTSVILISKPLALILSLGFVIRLVLHLGLTVRLALEVIGQSLLPTTPVWFLSLMLIGVSGYGASKGYETRARLAEVLIFIVLVPIGLVFVIAAFNVDYSNVLPLLATQPSTLIKGGFLTLSAFVGLELLLLVYPYVKNYRQIRRSASVAVVALGLLMTGITVITLARFGIYNIKGQLWPVIQMMDATNLPGSFIQRQGILMMSFFIISVFAITNGCLFFSSLLIKSVVKKGNHSVYVVICMGLGFGVSLLPANVMEVHHYLELTFLTFGLLYILVIPTLLLVIAKLRGLKSSALLILVIAITFTGCDKRELEERVFVMSMGIDRYVEGAIDPEIYRISYDHTGVTVVLSAVDLDDLTHTEKEIMVSDHRNVYDAMTQVDLNTNRDIYLGMTQTVVLGEGLLKEQLFTRSTVDFLNRNRELSKDALLLVTRSGVVDLLTAETKENKLGPAQPKFRKKDASLLDQIKTQSIENATQSLYRTGSALLPVVEIVNGYVELDALAIVQGYELVGYLEKPELLGYLLAHGDGLGASLTTHLSGVDVPLGIVSTHRQVSYEMGENEVVVALELKIKGNIESYGLEGLFDEETLEALRGAYEALVQAQVNTTYYGLADFDLDAFEFEEGLRKFHPKWYEVYVSEGLPLRLVTRAQVVIEGIGAIK